MYYHDQISYLINLCVFLNPFCSKILFDLIWDMRHWDQKIGKIVDVQIQQLFWVCYWLLTTIKSKLGIANAYVFTLIFCPIQVNKKGELWFETYLCACMCLHWSQNVDTNIYVLSTTTFPTRKIAYVLVELTTNRKFNSYLPWTQFEFRVSQIRSCLKLGRQLPTLEAYNMSHTGQFYTLLFIPNTPRGRWYDIIHRVDVGPIRILSKYNRCRTYWILGPGTSILHHFDP